MESSSLLPREILPAKAPEAYGGHGKHQKLPATEKLIIAGKSFASRLLIGTGKYRNLKETKAAVQASGAEIVTVALRRMNFESSATNEPDLLSTLSPDQWFILPNTAGCYTAESAVRVCMLARELLGHSFVKLEVLADKKTLFPDVIQTLKAAELLIQKNFQVMVYTNDDPVVATRFEEIGCVAVMPLAAPIGSGLGIRNPYNILSIVENARVPVIVDAGVGTASDAAIVMELGCDGVLMNTAIAMAKNPVTMAHAMNLAVQAGRAACLAGRMPRRRFASSSSPETGLLD